MRINIEKLTGGLIALIILGFLVAIPAYIWWTDRSIDFWLSYIASTPKNCPIWLSAILSIITFWIGFIFNVVTEILRIALV